MSSATTTGSGHSLPTTAPPCRTKSSWKQSACAWETVAPMSLCHVGPAEMVHWTLLARTLFAVPWGRRPGVTTLSRMSSTRLQEVPTAPPKLSHSGLSLLFQRYGLLMSLLRRPLLAACRRWTWGSARLRPSMRAQTALRACDCASCTTMRLTWVRWSDRTSRTRLSRGAASAGHTLPQQLHSETCADKPADDEATPTQRCC